MATVDEIYQQFRERINKAMDDTEQAIREEIDRDIEAERKRKAFLQEQQELNERLVDVRKDNEVRSVIIYYGDSVVAEHEVVSSPNRLLILNSMRGNIAVKAYPDKERGRHNAVNFIGGDTEAMRIYGYGPTSTILLARIIVCVALGWSMDDFEHGVPDYADGNMYNLTDSNLVLGDKTLAQILREGE